MIPIYYKSNKNINKYQVLNVKLYILFTKFSKENKIRGKLGEIKVEQVESHGGREARVLELHGPRPKCTEQITLSPTCGPIIGGYIKGLISNFFFLFLSGCEVRK